MSAVLKLTPATVDLFRRIGEVDADRVIHDPAPGTATYADAIRFGERSDGPRCEWIDGVLVEKAMGTREGWINVDLICLLGPFVKSRRLGRLASEACMIQVDDRQIRLPDLCFHSNARLAAIPFPTPAAVTIAPELAIEILSPANRPGEMDRKRREYFRAGVLLYWEVHPETRTIAVWTDADTMTILTEADTLDGGEILPDFTAAVADIFASVRR